MMSQAMGVCAERKDYDKVLKLLDFNLAAARRKSQQQSQRAAARARRARYASTGQLGYPSFYQILVGTRLTSVELAFPQADQYLDETNIVALRTAFELYKRDDLLSDLVQHFRRQTLAATSPTEAFYPRLARSSILWWNEEKDEAVAELTRIVESTGPESDLRFDLAELLVQQKAPGDALEILDAIQPLDNLSLKRREEMALTAAIISGNAERARHAAERLFGLRLDTDSQIRISEQMHQLGLHELAQAVLGRARRRAGGQAAVLANLMQQYQRQNKPDEAAQLAIALLRLSRTALPSSGLTVAAIESENGRSAAIRVLAGSGRLKQLIDRVREQLKKTPNSVGLHQTLADYYTASRQREQAVAELGQIARLRPNDVDLRLRLATQLIASGNTIEGLAHMKAAFERDPRAVAAPRLPLLMQQSNMPGEFIRLLNEIDFKAFSSLSHTVVMRAIAIAPADSALDKQIALLFQRAWKAFPEYRFYLVGVVARESVWQMPEMFDYAREAIFPGPTVRATFADYYPFRFAALAPLSPQNAPDKAARPAAIRLIDLAETRGSLESLVEQIDAARQKRPDWRAADFLRAMALCRAERFDEARALIPRAIQTLQKDQAYSIEDCKLFMFWCLGLELEQYAATRDLAFAAYEACARDPLAPIQFRILRTTSLIPVRQIVAVALQTGHAAEARRALSNMTHVSWSDSGYPAETQRIFRTIGLDMIATSLVELGYAADAVPLYREAVSLAGGIDTSIATIVAPNFADPVRQVGEHLNAAIDGLTQAGMAPIARRSLEEATATVVKAAGGGTSQKSVNESAAGAVDLITIVHPRNLDRATVRSLLADSIAACDPVELTAIRGPLDSLKKARPLDMSLAIATALAAFKSAEPTRIDTALEDLARLVEKEPLEKLASGARPNSRQRAQAAKQIPLWLVARACRAHPSVAVRAHGDRFAAQALEAARRQDDRLWTLAIMREQGQIAFDKNDRAAATATWTRMLDMVVTPQEARGRPSAGARPGAPALGRRPISGPAAGPTSSRPVAPPQDQP